MSDQPTPDAPEQAEPTMEKINSERETPETDAATVIGAGGDGAALDPALEKDRWPVRTSWKYFAGSLVLWFVLAVVTIMVVSSQATDNDDRGFLWQLKLDFEIIAGLGVVFLVRMFWTIYSRDYSLDNQRLRVRRGLLSKTIDQTELIRVDDVRMHQSLTDRILGVGTIEIMSTDATDKNLKIVGIADPVKVFDSIYANVRQLRRRSLFVKNL